MKLTNFFSFWLFLMCISSFGQYGPGGVEDTSGTSNLILWLDGTRISGSSGDAVGTLTDYSGYSHTATSTGGGTPTLQTGVVNGKSIVRFNGANNYFDGNLTSNLTSPSTVVVVGYFASLNQGFNDSDYLISFGVSGINGIQTGIARRQSNTGADINKYYSWDGFSVRFGPVLTGQTWSIFSQNQNTSSTYHQLNIDGTSQSVTDYTTSFGATSTAYSIGRWTDGFHGLNGDISEVIVYDKVLNSAEKNILHSYLEAKYNISVSGDKYIGDDVGNGDHDTDVVGIGTESDGSNNSAFSYGLTATQNTGFGNGDYLLLGHKVTTNSINSSDASDAGGNLEARWERVWWLDVTDAGTGTTVDLTFDISESGMGSGVSATISDYKLLYRSGTSGNWTLVTSSSSTNGDQIIFSNTSLSSDGYYTLGTIDVTNSPIGGIYLDTGDDGPGGIGSTDGTTNLTLWLDATELSGSSGDAVTSISDNSGNNHNATSSGFGDPTLQTSVINGNSVVRFNGTSNYFTGNLSVNLAAPSTIISVGYFGNINQGTNDNDYLVSFGPQGINGVHSGIARRKSGGDLNKYYSWDGITARIGPVITGQQWNIFTQLQNSFSTYHQLYIDGTSQTVTDYSTNYTATNTNYSIGRWQDGGHYLDGDEAEVIVFDKALNSAERNIMHSYLGAKYNVTVTGDKYTGDDVGNGDHDFYVAGIGTESDGSNTCASTKGIWLCENSNFGNGDYLIAGTKKVANDVNLVDATDATSTINGRWERVWWLDITDAGATLSADVVFDFSDADDLVFPEGTPSCYKLIYRSGTTGDWTILASAGSVMGDQVSFTGVSFSNDGYYTLGTCNIYTNPLPIELTYFDASVKTGENIKKNVLLKWITETEVNNDFFTLQKSKNGEDFENVGIINGSGNSFTRINYKFYDNEPYLGISYYRLMQTDYDGKTSYSKIVSVNIKETENVYVYPNPSLGSAKLEVILEAEQAQLSEVRLINSIGELVYSKHRNLFIGINSFNLDVSNLTDGTYQLLILSADKIYTTRYLKVSH